MAAAEEGSRARPAAAPLQADAGMAVRGFRIRLAEAGWERWCAILDRPARAKPRLARLLAETGLPG